jgi:hypothetical protein
MKRILFILFLLVSTPLWAEDPPATSPNDPEIVIHHGQDKTVYEYRVNGVLKEIKIVPKHGKEYYLVPSEGGWIKENESKLLIPSWVIFSW